MSDKDRVYKELTDLEHVKIKSSMYVGSTGRQSADMYILEDGRFIQRNISFTPALLKIIDEIIVNAIDHHINYPNKVKNIKINFDIKTGIISIYNDGPGITITKVDTLTNGKVYKPQAIFSQFRSGDNLEIGEQRIVGGMNGYGAKLTNAYSDIMKIETLCKNKLYMQTFRNRLEIIEEPIISKKVADDYTNIEFLPTYTAFGYKKYTEDDGADLYKLIEARAYQAAAFVNCNVWINGVLIDINGNNNSNNRFYNFCTMFTDSGLYHTNIINPDDKKLNMELCIGISDGQPKHISIVNGIWTYLGGSHIKFIQDMIVDKLKPYIEKELKKGSHKMAIKNLVLNNLFVFVKCTMYNPEFNSQSKEKVETPQKVFASYSIKESEWKKIWKLLEDLILESIYGKLEDKSKSKVDRKNIIFSEGSDAKFAGNKKRWRECTLFIAEGKSAIGLVEAGINDTKTKLNRDICGTWSIQGVPPNARKEVRIVKNRVIRNNKLVENKRFDELVKILGLDYNKTYAMNAEGDKEFETLRYGQVIVTTDQDVDGKGQIFGMILNFFQLFWPALIERNFIARFNTPIIRAYPNNVRDNVKEFYTQYAYDKWIDDTFGGDSEAASKKYKIKYYKGLASHDRKEVRPTFNNFDKKVFTYDNDTKANETIEIYFGKDTDGRKEVLSFPVSDDDIIKDDTVQHIDVSRYLNTDVKEFQRDNIIRKLPHVMDGLVPSRRKVLFAARLNDKMANEEIKVATFAGDVISKAYYHHGDASLCSTIIKMAQNFVGAKNLPLLIGIGNFGSRLRAGDDAGSPRYIYVKYNKKLCDIMFPREDDYLLPYTFSDGERAEPQYYVPILPMCILESMTIPATGWRVKIWARDYRDVINNVKDLINGTIKKCKSMKIWLNRNYSDIVVSKDDQYMVGKYEYNKSKNTITINELPLSVYNESYIKSIAYEKDKLKSYFKLPIDYSSYDADTNKDTVKIVFEFNEDIMDKLSAADRSKKSSDFDPVVDFMKLKLKIESDINVIDKNGKVKEYTKYGAVLREWFEERKVLYIKRIERQIIITKLMIRYIKNIIRFSESHTNLGITNKIKEEEFNEILKKNNYDKFYKTVLISPKYTPVDRLEKIILGEKASYDYLIGMTYKSLLSEANKARKKELDKLNKYLEELKDDYENSDFPGQKTWLREVSEVEKIIEYGITHGWSNDIKYKFE